MLENLLVEEVFDLGGGRDKATLVLDPVCLMDSGADHEVPGRARLCLLDAREIVGTRTGQERVQ
jgi:hypothetical protein